MDFPTIFGALCAPGALRPLGGVPLLGLFLAGLSGSVLHCAPMCGPFVLGQAATQMARTPVARLCELRRLQGVADRDSQRPLGGLRGIRIATDLPPGQP